MDSLGGYCGLSEDWRKQHVEDLHQLCCSPDIIWMNSIGEACGAYGGDESRHTGFWWKNIKERIHLDVLGLDGRILLEWLLDKNRKWCGLD